VKDDRVFGEFMIPKVRIPIEVLIDEIEKGWCLVCYLIINWRIEELMERARWRIPTETYKELATHLYNYVYEDVMPPDAIAPTILNVADDFVRGDPVRLRAGDYIALQNYMRAGR
jgi:hypothetical protein